MIAALLWSLGAITFAAEMAAIVVLIAWDGATPAKRGEGIETKAERDARLAKPLPAARDDLTEPVKRTPGATITPDLGESDTEQVNAPPVELLERILHDLGRPSTLRFKPEPPPWPWTLPPEPGLSTRYYAYEALGVNRVRTVEEILRPLGDMTIEFNRLMTAEFSEQKCDSCTVGRDGEHRHQSCVGCSCHCGDSQGAQMVPIGLPGRNVAA